MDAERILQKFELVSAARAIFVGSLTVGNYVATYYVAHFHADDDCRVTLWLGVN